MTMLSNEERELDVESREYLRIRMVMFSWFMSFRKAFNRVPTIKEMDEQLQVVTNEYPFPITRWHTSWKRSN
jgi:hypothetical protein